MESEEVDPGEGLTPVANDLGVCLVCETADSDGAFTIGPFPTAAHAEMYARTLPEILAEDVVLHGIVMAWSPETFVSVQRSWLALGVPAGRISDARGVHRKQDPDLPA